MGCAINLLACNIFLQTLLAVNHLLKEISARNSNPPLSKQSIDLNLIENESSKLLVLSLGTRQKVARYKATDAEKWGLFGWLTKDSRSPLIDILLQSSSDMSDIHEFFWFKTINMHMYLRIQVLFLHPPYIIHP